jgi:hypothetical protein
MSVKATLNGTAHGSGFLIAPTANANFPVPLALKTNDDSKFEAQLTVSPGGAGVKIDPSVVNIGPDETIVRVSALSPSLKRNDTVIIVTRDGALQESINITSIERPRLAFDGRFEVRFATNNDPYNHPRGGGIGWMWSLEGEPDFVPADSVPDRIEKPVGRVIKFQGPGVDRPHVPPIGVFVREVIGHVGGVEESFRVGDPTIGMPVNLGPHSYFASNRPVSPEDRALGRLPEEQHSDGLQPIGNFEFHIGEGFSGGSKVGPYVAGTTESSNPRNPDFRPRAGGLVALSRQEALVYPFPSLSEFETQRLEALLPDFVALKQKGETNTPEFRNLRTRIGHLLPGIAPQQQQQLLAEHSDVGLIRLGRSAGFAWGNREIYRGLVNDRLLVSKDVPGVIDYFSRFESLHFLCVFFNFHTDEARAHCYGAVDPASPPQTLDEKPIREIIESLRT